eukprot:TRINITY_DN6749_c0_g5_i1.p1 TRINITY_DN6749_c0_g5~~TRINITY_DN6749_c0_g5_i1.p1  ORF type:complete len:547 (+),score=61.30 TRINITY_DN6749_c0_g5_i1:122-1642(+)
MRYPMVLWVAVLGALFGSIQYGYHIGVLNTALNQLAVAFGYASVTGWQTSIIVATMLLGAAVGSLPSGSVADRIGPKRTMMWSSIFFLVGILICVLTPSVYNSPNPPNPEVGCGKCMIVFIIGRLLCGLGAGVAGVVSPRFIAEVAPLMMRGALGSLHQVFINVGIVIAYLMGLPYEDANPVYGWWWRFMMGFAAVFPIAQVLILSQVPESFRWLRLNNNLEGALNSGRRLWGAYWEEFQEVAEPFLELEDESRLKQEPFLGIFARKYYMFMLLGNSVIIFQQLSGINTVVLYSETIFEQVGLSSAVLGSVFVGIMNVIFTVISGLLMDRAGRKLLLIFSHAGMFVCLGGIAVVQMYLQTQLSENTTALIAFFLIVLYVIFFALGAGPIPWVYLAEIMPERIKGPAASLATSVSWTTVILVGFTFPFMLDALSEGPSYGIYALCNLGAVIFLAVVMLETKQMSFQAIEDKLLVAENPKKHEGEPAMLNSSRPHNQEIHAESSQVLI